MAVLEQLWPTLVAVFTLAVSLLASGHALLRKRDAPATVGWVGVIWLVPILGAGLYLLLGINRIHRRASRLGRPSLAQGTLPVPRGPLFETLGPEKSYLVDLVRAVDRVVKRPLLPGNRLEPLENGEAAYPAMLDAIARAEKSVAFCTYIYDNDRVGHRFAEALEAAVKRGVEVRVLVDEVGLRYSFPAADYGLRHRGIRTARFMPARVPWRMPYMNLRTHRKILVVDGIEGFTGGMNIREGHEVASKPRSPVRDLHFRVSGPVVGQLQEVFAEDWRFTTGETLEGPAWFPPLAPVGRTLARGIADGPDEDFDQLRWTLLAAVASARHSVQVVTPYFLPDAALTTALNLAALRGVQVDLVLPRKSNLVLVQWASTGQLWQILGHGVRVHLQGPPFDHSKILVVDGAWGLVGSANWDPRSLRLNFELVVECYDPAFARDLEARVAARIARSTPVGPEDLEARPLPVRLRDGAARLLSPYL